MNVLPPVLDHEVLESTKPEDCVGAVTGGHSTGAVATTPIGPEKNRIAVYILPAGA
ncbi:MAG TPA: hypothetical protein VF701_20530 [Thermoanaerobaculia bacterium]